MAKIRPTTFLASQFTPTQFDTAEVKAAFANKLIRFMIAGFPKGSFDKKFYKRLSMTFGHIAHYDQNGFYSAQFSTLTHQVLFVQNLMRWPCHGSPTHTYCDVEKAVAEWCRTSGIMSSLAEQLEIAVRESELKRLAELQAKYPDYRPA